MSHDPTQPPPFNVGRTGPVIPLTEHRVIVEQVTLRDQFAMTALPAIISKQEAYIVMQAATIAYSMADAMLKAREAK